MLDNMIDSVKWNRGNEKFVAICWRFVAIVNARDNFKWLLQKLPKTRLTPLNV